MKQATNEQSHNNPDNGGDEYGHVDAEPIVGDGSEQVIERIDDWFRDLIYPGGENARGDAKEVERETREQKEQKDGQSQTDELIHFFQHCFEELLCASSYALPARFRWCWSVL